MRIRPAAQHRATGRRRSVGVLCGFLLTPVAIAAAIYLTAGGGFVRLGLSSNGPAQPSPTTAASAASATSPASATSSPSPSPSASPSPAATTAPPSQQTAADQVLALINQARAQAGLPAYSFLAGLNNSAAAHNARM